MATAVPGPGGMIIVMGVSGCGKSVIGAELASRLGVDFIDADQLHCDENIRKMRAGDPLGDAERWPWLERVAATMRVSAAKRRGVVGACSALRKAYRQLLVEQTGQPIRFVHLQASKEIIAKRLGARPLHFMPAGMLASQLATLEAPDEGENAISINADVPVDMVVADILAKLQAAQSEP